jgi:hypothetical protein
MTCAYLQQIQAPNHPSTVIFVGNINNGVCDPFVFFPDTHGQRAMINGHEFGVDIDDSGGTLYYDGKIFYFVKDSI